MIVVVVVVDIVVVVVVVVVDILDNVKLRKQLRIKISTITFLLALKSSIVSIHVELSKS